MASTFPNLHDCVFGVLAVKHGHEPGALLRPVARLAVAVIIVIDRLVALERGGAPYLAQPIRPKSKALAISDAEGATLARAFEVEHPGQAPSASGMHPSAAFRCAASTPSMKATQGGKYALLKW